MPFIEVTRIGKQPCMVNLKQVTNFEPVHSTPDRTLVEFPGDGCMVILETYASFKERVDKLLAERNP